MDYLNQLISQYAPKIAQAFYTSIASVVDNVVLKDVTKFLELGDLDAAFRALGLSPAALRPLTTMIENAFEQGGVVTGQGFPGRLYTPLGSTVFRFDVRNSRAEAWLRNSAGDFITLIESDAKNAIRTALSSGVTAGQNPRTIAIELVGRINPKTQLREGGLFGLNKPQQTAVANMRSDLTTLNNNYFNRQRRDRRFDGTVRKMFESGNISEKDIVRLTGRYKNNLLKLRGDTIGRDGAIEALNASEMEAYNQAVDMGAVEENGIQRFWDSAGRDGRTRDDHLAMDDKPPVGLKDAFIFPDGSKAMHPQDRSLGAPAEQTVNCRCRVRTVVDWLAGVE